MNTSFDKKFTLVVVFWLSVSLTTPVLHGLGYTWPGLFSRALLTAISLAAFTLVAAYPVLAAVLPLAVLVTATVTWLTAPHILVRIALMLYSTVVAGYMFYPVIIIVAVSLALFIFLAKHPKPLPPAFYYRPGCLRPSLVPVCGFGLPGRRFLYSLLADAVKL
jgi:hypothetical protein